MRTEMHAQQFFVSPQSLITLNGMAVAEVLVAPQNDLPRAEQAIHCERIGLQELSRRGVFGDPLSHTSTCGQSWYFILPVSGAISGCLPGIQAAAGDLLVLTPGYQPEIQWHERTQAVLIRINEHVLQEHLAEHQQLALSTQPGKSYFFQAAHPEVESLRNLVNALKGEAGNCLGLLSSQTGQRHVQHLLCEIFLGLYPALSSARQCLLLPGSIKRAVEYIHANLDQPLDIAQLVDVCKASRRSLELGFRRYLNTSPMRYVQVHRLNAIRDILKRHRPGQVQLCKLSYDWGFSHPSYFSAAYKQIFNELPSQTLAGL